MTLDVRAPDRARVEAAFRALYLLPTAPRELIDAVYATLANAGVQQGLRDAYEIILTAPEHATGARFPRRISPWELLHLQPDAPQCVLVAAYNIWHGSADPLDLRPPAMNLVPAEGLDARDASSTLPWGEWSGLRTEAEVFISAYEELLGTPREIEQLSSNRNPKVEAFVYTYEELLNGVPRAPLAWGEGSALEAKREELLDSTEEIEQQQITPPCVGAGPGERSEHPTLIGLDGESHTLGHRPLRIGTQPSCDIVVRADVRVEARVWRNKGRMLVHALGEPGLVLVNGRSETWAVLNDGDTLAVGPAAFSFRVG